MQLHQLYVQSAKPHMVPVIFVHDNSSFSLLIRGNRDNFPPSPSIRTYFVTIVTPH